MWKSLERVRALMRVQASGMIGPLRGVVPALLLFLVVLTAAARWDGTCLVVLGIRLEEYALGQDRAGTLHLYLKECIGWAWLITGLFYLLPTVLLPLAGSFAPSQMLWLRLSPCTARDVAAARAGRMLLAVLILSALTVPAVTVAALAHDVPVWPLLGTGAGLLAQVVWSGGVVLACGPMLSTPAGRALGAFVAFLMPVVSFLLFAALRTHLPVVVVQWWPYALPFAPDLGGRGRHALAGVLVGLVLLMVSIVIQPGRRPETELLTRKEQIA